MDSRLLTPLQQGFVTAYLENRSSATQAAITAGCKPASAHVTACRWLKLAKVQAAIQDITAKATERAEITQAEILARLRELAMLAPQDTKGTITGQVAACKELAEVLGWKEHAADEAARVVSAGYMPSPAALEEASETARLLNAMRNREQDENIQ